MLQALSTNGSGAPVKATDTKHRQLSWFAERVARGMEAPFVEICTITPEIATHILENNESNRPISAAAVIEISNDIVHKNWQLNGETIIISREGKLNDGQHRLLAVVDAGEPIRTCVAFGATRESRFTVNMGRQRTTGNFMGMNGVTNSNEKASAALLHACYLKGIYGRRGKGKESITKQDVLKHYRSYEKQFEEAAELLLNEKFVRIAGKTSVLCAHVILNKRNMAESAVFFQRLCDGARLDHGSPILMLRQVLLDKSLRLEAHEKLELILRYWNAFREGRKVRRALYLMRQYPKVID